MGIKRKVAAAIAVAAVGVGGLAASATAAYDLTGGPFTVTTGYTSFTAAGIYDVECSDATYVGDTDNVPGDPASMEFTPSFSNCQETPGYPMVAKVPNPWKLTVVGEQYPGTYDVRVDAPGGVLVEFEFPIPAIYPCRSSYMAPPGGLTGEIVEGSSEITWTNLDSVEYDVRDCMFVGSGPWGSFVSDPVTFPGVQVDVL